VPGSDADDLTGAACWSAAAFEAANRTAAAV
jgi:hypothetical protein